MTPGATAITIKHQGPRISRILGIESSCDETAAAVVEDGWLVQSNVIASQHDLHRRFGGVVPEIASRAHLERISSILDEALRTAGVGLDELDAIAVGNRPGLIGSLLVGVGAAKALAWSTGLPLIGIDHVQAHLHAASLISVESSEFKVQRRIKTVPFPALALVVSGGHTALYEVRGPMDVRLLGRTIDDAVGEAYDKAAVILDAGYPGGPHLDRLARDGNPETFDLPRAALGPDSLDFSFSGLKTALLYAVRGQPQGGGGFKRTADDLTPRQRTDFAASFQAAAVDVLILKIERALDVLTKDGRPPRCLIIGGGVSANSLLRTRATELGELRDLGVYLPDMAFCLDNAAMIAGLAFEHLRQGRVDDLALPAVATV